LKKLAEEKELREKEEAGKEETKDKIVKNVTEIISQKVEKLKEELIKKTVEETSKAIEQSFFYSNSGKKPNTSVHEGFTCDGCNMYPIVGARYKCNVCRNFDFCGKCEDKFGDDHGHEMTKHRVPVQRFGGCPWKRGRGFYGNFGEKKEGCRFRKFQRFGDPFMKFVSEQFGNAKDFFCSNENSNEKQTEETKTTSDQKDDIVVENVKKEETKVSYQNELNALRSTFDLGSKTDEEIMNALVQANGNMDEAVILLFL